MSNNAAAGIDLLCLDVDGVMTDGGICVDDNGVETKRFHVRDGTGIRVWTKLGYQVALVTGRSGSALKHRAAELGIRHVVQASTDKAQALDDLLGELSLAPNQAVVTARIRAKPGLRPRTMTTTMTTPTTQSRSPPWRPC